MNVAPTSEKDADKNALAFTARAVVAHPLWTIAFAIVVVSAFFLAFPSIDIAVSSLFHADGDFPARHNAFLRRLRELGPFLVRAIAFLALGALIVRAFWPALRDKIDIRAPVFLLSSLALGPGLLVNAILKDNWGRARPKQIDLFGGDAAFSPVWEIAGNCARNCSFVSGEASSAAWLMALAFLAPAGWRKPLAAAIGVLVLFLSLNRIAFGGHFLSDTILSWLLTLGVLFLLYRLLYVSTPKFLSAPNLEAAVERAGGWLKAAANVVGRVFRSLLRAFARHFR